ncbi:hypothetical protein ACQ4WX_01940 [Streptomyces lasalocidi]
MRSHHSHAGAVLAVVHEPLGAQAWSPLVLELCGLARAGAEAVAARVAEHHRSYDVELDDVPDDLPDAGRLGRYLLRLTPALRPETAGRSPTTCWPTCWRRSRRARST